MFDPKVRSVFDNLEKQSSYICDEIKSLVGNISAWADELTEIIGKEYATDKESTLFLLPKTPGEKRTRNRKGTNALIPKHSVINSTFLNNETTTLDESISTRTRGARRAASKMPQLSIAKDMNKTQVITDVQNFITAPETTKGEASDVTFIMSKASTRTKPVSKNKQPEGIVPEIKTPEPKKNESITSNPPTSSPEVKESPVKKISQTPPQRTSRRESSKTSSGASPEEMEKTLTVVNETPVDRLSRRKTSRTLSGSPSERQGSRKLFRSLSGSPVVRSSSLRSSKNHTGSPAPTRNSRSNSRIDTNISTNQYLKASTPETRSPQINRTVTIKKEPTPSATSTFVVTEETMINDEEIVRTPTAGEERFFRLSNTSTPAVEKPQTRETSMRKSQEKAETNVAETVTDDEVPKKKRKLKKDEEVKENIEEVGETVRITRTKSKAIRQLMEENEMKQADLSAFAKKLLNKAKKTSLKKSQLAALLECNSSTPTNGPGLGNNFPFGNLTTSKYHLLLSSSKLKTPLATLPNSAIKITKASGDKPKIVNRGKSIENTIRSATKPKNDTEKEMKLKTKKEKEEEAALKRQKVMKNKQEELRRKNELKHQLAMKQREKLEQEKYNNMIQSEKEKEERHRVILQERQMKLKEEALKKKVLTQQKIAETVERRRQEEEARIAKLKEMEAEEQRLALEKQKEQERQEKRAQERLAQKKAREEYELQMKQELEAERLKAEKLLTAKKCMPGTASKMQSASKKPKFGVPGEKREWDYKPRNENDYGLEDEHSEVDSEDEKSYDKAKPAVPWGKKIMHGKSPFVKVLTLEMMCEFMPCYQKSPDIHKMFKMTPSKRLKRTSSAIWNTPSS